MTLLISSSISGFLNLFIWMLGSFLIGYFFAWNYYKSKYKHQLHERTETIQELRTEMQSTIRAKKTVERGGIEIKQPKELNFETLGNASEEQKDDLTQINGIGSFIEKKLNSIGIYTYEQLSKLNTIEIETITDLIQFFPGRIVRDQWKEQAIALLKTKENEA